MSGPKAANRADLATALALLQPRLIANRLFADASFCSDFGIDQGQAVSLDGAPPVFKTALYESVRELLSDGRPRSLRAANGEELQLEVAGDSVAIFFAADDGTTAAVYSLILMLLSPNADMRQRALRMMFDDLGPTGPDPAEWRPELQNGPLDNAGMDRFWHQIHASIVPNMARVERAVLTGTLDRTHLVPRSLDYWRAVCGSPVNHMDQETWLKEIFEPHRKRLIERDLVRGLDLCLAMGLRDDLTPRSLIENVSNDACWEALQHFRPADNPVSLIGVADITSSRAQTDLRFAAVAEQAVRRLCEPQFRRSDGLDIYSLLLTLVSFISGELRTVPGIASEPAYWRQICSWTQAALLVRSFATVHFNLDELSQSLDKMRTAEGATAELLDLRQMSLSHPSLTNPARLRAEVLGRLLLLRERLKAQGVDLPGDSEFAAVIKQETQVDPFLIQLPGPLELDRLPIWSLEALPEHFQSELCAMIDTLPTDIADDRWMNFVYLASLIRYDGAILARMTELMSKAELASVNVIDKRRAIVHIAQLAYLATAQRHAALAEAILVRCLEAVGPLTDAEDAGAFVRIGLIATAALSDATSRFAQYLANLANLLPQGAACEALSAEMGVLRSLTPAKDWHRFSRAEALSALGS